MAETRNSSLGGGLDFQTLENGGYWKFKRLNIYLPLIKLTRTKFVVIELVSYWHCVHIYLSILKLFKITKTVKNVLKALKWP